MLYYLKQIHPTLDHSTCGWFLYFSVCEPVEIVFIGPSCIGHMKTVKFETDLTV